MMIILADERRYEDLSENKLLHTWPRNLKHCSTNKFTCLYIVCSFEFCKFFEADLRPHR